MAWKGREKKQIDYIDLLSVLINSKIQQSNPPLYQVISTLLKRLADNKSLVEGNLEDIETQLVEIGDTIININGGGGGAAEDATYLTVDDETAELINSVRLLAGTGIIFDDTVPNQRTVISNAAISMCFIPMVNGEEPPQLLSNGYGDLILIGYTI